MIKEMLVQQQIDDLSWKKDDNTRVTEFEPEPQNQPHVSKRQWNEYLYGKDDELTDDENPMIQRNWNREPCFKVNYDHIKPRIPKHILMEDGR